MSSFLDQSLFVTILHSFPIFPLFSPLFQVLKISRNWYEILRNCQSQQLSICMFFSKVLELIHVCTQHYPFPRKASQVTLVMCSVGEWILTLHSTASCASTLNSWHLILYACQKNDTWYREILHDLLNSPLREPFSTRSFLILKLIGLK